MHLAVLPKKASVGVQDRATVVVNAGCATLEDGDDEHGVFFFGNPCQFFRRGSRHGFREIEKLRVFGAAKIFAAEQLMHADDLRTAPRCIVNFTDGALQVFRRILRGFHLHEPNGEFVGHEI